MRHITFVEEGQERYDVAILIKPTYFTEQALRQHYVNPLREKGIGPERLIAFDLKYENNKASTKTINAYLAELMPVLLELGIKYIYCADSAYFKVLAKQSKADGHFGYMYNAAYKECEHMQVTVGLNHGALIYNPELYTKIDMSLTALADSMLGQYSQLGADIIQYEDYPSTFEGIEWMLNRLHQYPVLTCDIETFSLNVNKAGLGTIAFAWSKHEGTSFCVDYVPNTVGDDPKVHGARFENKRVRKLLRQFFESYKGKLIFHNATYDTKCLIRALWMSHSLDRQGLLHGLHTLYRSIHDTKIITYLSTNSTAGNELGLKTIAHEFAGNWAQSDINDITLIEQSELLRYNLVDCLSTFYAFEKYYPVMVADKQLEIYNDLMIPTLKVLTQIELIGMPMNPEKIKAARAKLSHEESICLDAIFASPDVAEAQRRIQHYEMDKANAKLKTKVKPIEDFAHIKFNPNSGAHLAVLLHEVMGLPVLERTRTKLPATGGDILEKLIHHCDEAQRVTIQALIDLGSVAKILSAFLPAFEAGTMKEDGRMYLHGGFNLGGTVSGRLSSSKPNLQNLPSGSKWGALIKECFEAAQGHLFCGADFNALEDRINTLLTKDTNKVKVYTDGYDGHCLRAYYYFGDQMPDVVQEYEATTSAEERVKIINSIAKRYKKLRQMSKAPTFALTYGGTWITLMKNCGFTEAMAKQIEANYHKMYVESDKWMEDQIKICCDKGYATVAFGLRIRTPLLKQVVLNTHKTPKEAEAEARSVGNAIGGQSYGLLNNRAIVEFMDRVWNSPYKYDIVPVALIHDAIYLIIKDDVEIVSWANNNLTECMAWNELPEIQHESIKLSAELDIYYPNWSSAITLPNGTTPEQVNKICKAWYADYQTKQAA